MRIETFCYEKTEERKKNIKEKKILKVKEKKNRIPKEKKKSL